MEENFCVFIDYFLSHGIDRNEVIHRSVSNKEGHCYFNERAILGMPVTTSFIQRIVSFNSAMCFLTLT